MKNGDWESVSNVIILISYKLREYYTLSEDGESAEIIVDSINEIPYLKTVPNDKAEDNLGNLPEVE